MSDHAWFNYLDRDYLDDERLNYEDDYDFDREDNCND